MLSENTNDLVFTTETAASVLVFGYESTKDSVVCSAAEFDIAFEMSMEVPGADTQGRRVPLPKENIEIRDAERTAINELGRVLEEFKTSLQRSCELYTHLGKSSACFR